MTRLRDKLKCLCSNCGHPFHKHGKSQVAIVNSKFTGILETRYGGACTCSGCDAFTPREIDEAKFRYMRKH